MKNIKSKFKIHPCTYGLLFLSFCSGYFKNILIIFGIVIFHELGHLFFIHSFHYSVLNVEIYPFGGITRVEKLINTPLKKEMIIALGGVFFQVILFFVISLAYQSGWFLERTYFLFQNYNKVIFIFNLLPLAPLDGSIIVHSILEYFFSYQKAYFFYLIFSILALLGFITFHSFHSLNNYMMIVFLILKIYEAYQKRKHYQNKFYLERYLYDLPYEKIKSHPNIDILNLKKDTLHFFWKKDRYLHEKEILKEHYSK